MPLTSKQFAAEIKRKYPQYGSVPDDQLVKAILAKYPQYQSQLLDVGKELPKGQASTGPHGLAALRALIHQNMPLIMGTGGGLAGGAVGGPVGAVIGAGLGGGTGELVEKGGGKGGFPEDIGTDVALSALEQGGAEFGGMALGKLGQWIKGPAREALISYATRSGQLGPEIKAVLPDLDRVASRLGAKVTDVADLRHLGQLTERELNQEFNQALFPIARQQAQPMTVANEIRAEITNNPNLANTSEGQRVINHLKRRALEFEQVRAGGQPWTIGDLNLERMRLTKKLDAYHKAMEAGGVIRPGIKAEMDADAAAERALKDMLYNAADQSGMKPPGYFQALKQRQSALISLNQSMKKGEESITKQSLERKGAPLSEKLHLRTYLHPQSGAPEGVAGVSPSAFRDPMKAAGRQASKAFPTGARKAIDVGRKAAGTIISQPDVNALALRGLLGWSQGDFDVAEPPQ